MLARNALRRWPNPICYDRRPLRSQTNRAPQSPDGGDRSRRPPGDRGSHQCRGPTRPRGGPRRAGTDGPGGADRRGMLQAGRSADLRGRGDQRPPGRAGRHRVPSHLRIRSGDGSGDHRRRPRGAGAQPGGRRGPARGRRHRDGRGGGRCERLRVRHRHFVDDALRPGGATACGGARRAHRLPLLHRAGTGDARASRCVCRPAGRAGGYRRFDAHESGNGDQAGAQHDHYRRDDPPRQGLRQSHGRLEDDEPKAGRSQPAHRDGRHRLFARRGGARPRCGGRLGQAGDCDEAFGSQPRAG